MPLDVRYSVHATKSVPQVRICFKEQQSHEWSAASQRKDRNSSLPATRTEWRLSSDRRAFTGSSIPECPNSVRVTFSRRSPQWRPLDLRNPVQSREKRAWNSSRRSHVRSCKRSHTYRSHQRSGSNRKEEHSPALLELTQIEYPHPRRP
jgi:hypothetical protein